MRRENRRQRLRVFNSFFNIFSSLGLNVADIFPDCQPFDSPARSPGLAQPACRQAGVDPEPCSFTSSSKKGFGADERVKNWRRRRTERRKGITFQPAGEVYSSCDRQVPLNPALGGGVKGHNIKKAPYREALRYTQGRELCRTATPFMAWSFTLLNDLSRGLLYSRTFPAFFFSSTRASS